MMERGWKRLLAGTALSMMTMLAACSETDEEIPAEELVGDEAVEQEVDQQAKSLEEAADEAVKIMEEEISVTSSTTLQVDADTGND